MLILCVVSMVCVPVQLFTYAAIGGTVTMVLTLLNLVLEIIIFQKLGLLAENVSIVKDIMLLIGTVSCIYVQDDGKVTLVDRITVFLMDGDNQVVINVIVLDAGEHDIGNLNRVRNVLVVDVDFQHVWCLVGVVTR